MLGGRIVSQVILAVYVMFIIAGSLCSTSSWNYPPLWPFDIDFNWSACCFRIHLVNRADWLMRCHSNTPTSMDTHTSTRNGTPTANTHTVLTSRDGWRWGSLNYCNVSICVIVREHSLQQGNLFLKRLSLWDPWVTSSDSAQGVGPVVPCGIEALMCLFEELKCLNSRPVPCWDCLRRQENQDGDQASTDTWCSTNWPRVSGMCHPAWVWSIRDGQILKQNTSCLITQNRLCMKGIGFY